MVLRWEVCVGWQVENPELEWGDGAGAGCQACPTWREGDLGLRL